MDILGAIGQGIIDSKDKIQSIASDTIFNIVTALQDNAPAAIDGAIAILESLVGAILENTAMISAIALDKFTFSSAIAPSRLPVRTLLKIPSH